MMSGSFSSTYLPSLYFLKYRFKSKIRKICPFLNWVLSRYRTLRFKSIFQIQVLVDQIHILQNVLLFWAKCIFQRPSYILSPIYQLFLGRSYLWHIQDLKFSRVLSCIGFAVDLGLGSIWVSFLVWGTISFLQMAFQTLQYPLLTILSPYKCLGIFFENRLTLFWDSPFCSIGVCGYLYANTL